MQQTEELCARLRANDPTLSVIRTYDIEDYDTSIKLIRLMAAAKHSQHIKWMYVDLDHLQLQAWESLAGYANLSRSLEKLWVWNLRSNVRTEYVSQLFSAMNPRAVSLEGFGMEIREPDRPFLRLERAKVENFFARNDTIIIVNILCEARRPTPTQQQQRTKIVRRQTSSDNFAAVVEPYFFLDCALSGLQRNQTVQHLILRHSDQDENCCMKIRPTSLMEFFRYNQAVHTISFLVGNSVKNAKALGNGLKFNQMQRALALYSMSEEASIAFFEELPKAVHLDTLTLRECRLGSKPVLTALNEGIASCRGLRQLDVGLGNANLFDEHLNDILKYISPSIEGSSLIILRIANGTTLDSVGASALGEALSSSHCALQHVELLNIHQITDRAVSELANRVDFFTLQKFHIHCSMMSHHAYQGLNIAFNRNPNLLDSRIICTKVVND